MSYRIGLLDKSPLDGNEPAEQALARTVHLAQTAEKLGYSRFWVAEHHNNPGVAGSAPEVLIAHLLARTSTIRIGSGGIMLNHYSPYKVAEVARLLATLAPGRVDLGVGKAPGGLPEAARALRQVDDALLAPFERKLADLSAYLSGTASLRAFPIPATAPQRFMLGASVESAELANRYGWTLVHAGHIDGDEAQLEAVIAASDRKPVLALAAIAAESAEAARALAGDLTRWRLHIPGRQSVNLGSEAAAERYAAEIGAAEYRIERKTPRVLLGTAHDIHAHLQDLHRRHGIDEFIIDCPVSQSGARIASITQIAAHVRETHDA